MNLKMCARDALVFFNFIFLTTAKQLIKAGGVCIKQVPMCQNNMCDMLLIKKSIFEIDNPIFCLVKMTPLYIHTTHCWANDTPSFR